MGFETTLNQTYEEGDLPESVFGNFQSLYTSYRSSMIHSGFNMDEYDHLFHSLLTLVIKQLREPCTFEHFHKRIEQPYDYHRFGKEFIRPLVDEKRSFIHHAHNVKKMEAQVRAGENVILFANHQTEVDPQLMCLILEKSHPEFSSEVIFVAGDRVITDPLAIPFSLGCNLLCIYSKRHVDNPPELKAEKLQHNQRTMKRMKELLIQGGQCIYMAPSGGRDRPNQDGEVVVAPFDPHSIEMFRLMAKQAKTPTHFYPLSLVTFDILPPPQTIGTELGETRLAHREGALFAFGDEIDMETFPGSDIADKHAKRSARSMHIWNLVKTQYNLLKSQNS